MNRVFRCYTENRALIEARSVLTELKEILGIRGLITCDCFADTMLRELTRRNT